MKKTSVLVAVAAVAMTGAVALAQTNVYSRNAVGAVRVDIPPTGQFVLCGFNFKPIGSDSTTLLSLLGTNVPGHTTALRATRVHMWDPYANAGGGGYLSVYFRTGQWHTIVGNVVTNPTIAAGAGFWIQSGSTAPTTFPLFIMGEVISSGVVDRVMEDGFSLISNPYSAPLNLNDTNISWQADGATGRNVALNADTVYVWNGVGYDNYYLKADYRWYYVIGGAYASNAVIPVGAGAWYKAKVPFTNSLVRPYPWW